ncbi:twin-arginine translocation signal domain-containing protein [Brucella inopinata]|uniref:Twin-arginine translocation signal domain-containing protein n=1 Tax=Brucella inopinata TaxID=1218315 RepID=A0AAW7BCV9_9HYPH|nr:twin-arginine translocation signal domain-containing protein [Brucella inopinata]KEY05500.1 hypothetical protein IL59_0203355 [Brucella suis bv. 4 str. 40]MDL2334266.1 twin-arginine translocation signal domain-containing protein [Brucella inopinata]
MNRRRFLSFLGLAPVAAAVPAMALPRPEKPTEIDKLTVTVEADTTELRRLIAKVGEDVRRQYMDSIDAPLYDPLKHGDDFDAWWDGVKS